MSKTYLRVFRPDTFNAHAYKAKLTVNELKKSTERVHAQIKEKV